MTAPENATSPPRPLVLVTSFEPFGGSPVNPTVEIARLIAAMPCATGARIFATLPVVSGEGPGSAWAMVRRLLRRHAPDAVVALGESAKADRVVFERVAINLRDAPIADNAGQRLVDAPIAPRGPDACFATLPLRAMLAACESSGVAAQLSLSAGAFLCNETMYRLLRRRSRGGAPIAGFIHVPQLPDQAAVRGGPAMDAPTSARGVHAALEALALRLAEGETQ